MSYSRKDVPIPTIGQHCDVHVRATRRPDPAVIDLHYAGIYDRERHRWYTTADFTLSGAALQALLNDVNP